MFRSLWRFLLVTYQEAEVIRHRHMDWNAWRVLVFEGFAGPHSIPSRMDYRFVYRKFVGSRVLILIGVSKDVVWSSLIYVFV